MTSLVGWGASGRNGGQVNPIGHESPEVIGQHWGKDLSSDFAQRYIQMTLNSADANKTRIIDWLRSVYPQFPDLEIEYIWGGQIAVTRDHLPHIHQIAPGLLAGLGCNGRGVALSTVMGRLLAETALGQNLTELPIPITGIKRYPFHRFHRVGIKIAVAWKEFCDNREAS